MRGKTRVRIRMHNMTNLEADGLQQQNLSGVVSKCCGFKATKNWLFCRQDQPLSIISLALLINCYVLHVYCNMWLDKQYMILCACSCVLVIVYADPLWGYATVPAVATGSADELCWRAAAYLCLPGARFPRSSFFQRSLHAGHHYLQPLLQSSWW